MRDARAQFRVDRLGDLPRAGFVDVGEQNPGALAREAPGARAAPRPWAAPVISAFLPTSRPLIPFSSAERRSLQRHQRRDPAAGQREKFQELHLAERRAFGRALHLDQSA
jgi:hypothetical protein